MTETTDTQTATATDTDTDTGPIGPSVVLENISRDQLRANMEAIEKEYAPLPEEVPEYTPDPDPDLPPAEDEDGDKPDEDDEWDDEHAPPKPTDDPKAFKVPRERLNKEIERRRTLEVELAQYRAGGQPQVQPQQFQQPVAPLAPVKPIQGEDQVTAWVRQNVPEIQQAEARIAQIEASQDNFASLGEYIGALTDAKSDRAALIQTAKSQVTTGVQRQAEAQQQVHSQRLQKWESVKSSEVPEVRAAAARLDARAHEFHPHLLQAITDAEDPAVFTRAMMSTPKTAEWFASESRKAMATGQPISPAVLMRLGQLAALTQSAAKPAAKPAETQAPQRAASSTPPKGNVGAQSAVYWEKIADSDPVKYNRLLRSGKAPDIFGLKGKY